MLVVGEAVFGGVGHHQVVLVAVAPGAAQRVSGGCEVGQAVAGQVAFGVVGVAHQYAAFVGLAAGGAGG